MIEGDRVPNPDPRIDAPRTVIYDDVIMRTIVDLPLEQVAARSDFCKNLGISRAEGVRRALARMLEDADDNHFQKAFGAWKHRGMDPTDYVNRIREEWER